MKIQKLQNYKPKDTRKAVPTHYTLLFDAYSVPAFCSGLLLQSSATVFCYSLQFRSSVPIFYFFSASGKLFSALNFPFPPIVTSSGTLIRESTFA